MRLTIFGGTGPTGLLLVDYALAQGHEVVAFARTPSKLPVHERLTAVAGQLDNVSAINEAVRGSDAVISLLGPGTKADDNPPLVTGYRNIVAAMHDQGIARLVALGTPTMADPADGKDFTLGMMARSLRLFKPAIYDIIMKIRQAVRESGLDWTLVRVPFLTDGPKTEINVRMVGGKGSMRLSRANAATFLLEQAADPAQIGRAPFISDK